MTMRFNMTRSAAALRPVPKISFDDLRLLPSQQSVYDQLLQTARAAPVTAFNSARGMGATTLLKRLANDLDALFVDARRVSEEIRAHPALKWEEVVHDMLVAGLRERGAVVIDNYRDICGIGAARSNLFRAMMRDLKDFAIQSGSRLILGGTLVHRWETPANTFGEAAALVASKLLTADDYRALFEHALGNAASGLNINDIYRAAPTLDLHRLLVLINLLIHEAAAGLVLTTAHVEHIIETKIVRSNLRIREVEALSFDSLPGTEHIADALETHVVLPLRNKALANRLNLKPRRGVLLYGPPGTGKTSIGRALAHRMQGRFYLIDGSFITEPASWFFAQIDAVITQAKKNAPSVLFIDDADVLFEIEHVAGLARYLLSLLDGLESETASGVCIMMTAMDAKKIPDALLRSGRVELWLETKHPDEATRAQILERWLASAFPDDDAVDYVALARKAEGFTPADLRRLTGDAKLLYAADIAAGKPLESIEHYLSKAISELIETRAIMADRLANDALRIRAYA
jgi:transitional endoplasmic reticulum ATPase